MFNLKLERYLLGELSPAETKQLEKALSDDAALRAELERLRGDTAAYFAKYPNLNAKRRTPWWQRRITRVVGGGLVFAAASAAIVLLLPRAQGESQKIALNNDNPVKPSYETMPEGNEIRTKGLIPGLFLSAHDKTLKDGDRVKAGEKIEIAYRASGYRYGAILSVDRERSVTVHFPEDERVTPELQKEARVPLKLAFELDEKPGFEKFYFVTSQSKIAVAELRRQLAKTGKLTATSGDIRIVSIRLNKE